MEFKHSSSKKLWGRAALLSAAVIMFSCLSPASAKADVTQKDMEILAKAIGFVEGGPSGDVKVDILSGGEADTVAGILSGGLSSGKVKLIGTKTAASTGAKVAYIPAGAEGQAAALVSKGIITVSANPDCAKSGACVIAVTATPKVEIHVSKAAAEKAGVSFASAFRMMITEH